MPKNSSNNNANVKSSVYILILNDSSECRDKLSKESLSFPVSATSESEQHDLTTKLKPLRVRDINRIITTQYHIKSIKIYLLAQGVRGNINILTTLEN